MLELRDYQRDALDGLFNYWEEGKGTDCLIVAPTGSGKSLLISEFIRRVCVESPHIKILVVAHVKELIKQNFDELKGHYPEVNAGIYSAGLGKRNTTSNVIMVGIQSIYNKAFEFGRVDIVIIDECHMIPRNSQTRYGKFLSDIKLANPHAVCVGFTATPFRLDSGMLHEGDDAIFSGIAYCCEIKRLIAEGYLCPVISKGGVMKIDLSNVHMRMGDYDNGELARAADDPELIKHAVAEIVTYGQDRKAWLIFCAGVAHAEHVATEIESYGIVCKIITGETPSEERDQTIKDFKDGKVRCIVNVGVLTTGFNSPVCDLIAMLFSTASTGKYIQVVGRGMRTYPGKENCLLLDFGNNIITHGCIDDVDPIRTRNVFNVEKRPPAVKECPNCRAILYAREMVCPACDYRYPATAPHGVAAYDGAVLKSQQQPFFVEVVDTWFSRHKKSGKPDILKIAMYDAQDREFPIWCCLGHDGYAREKAIAVVKSFGGTATTVDEALKENEFWKKPVKIKVAPNGKFFNVVGIEFAKGQPIQQHFEDTVEEEAPKYEELQKQVWDSGTDNT